MLTEVKRRVRHIKEGFLPFPHTVYPIPYTSNSVNLERVFQCLQDIMVGATNSSAQFLDPHGQWQDTEVHTAFNMAAEFIHSKIQQIKFDDVMRLITGVAIKTYQGIVHRSDLLIDVYFGMRTAKGDGHAYNWGGEYINNQIKELYDEDLHFLVRLKHH